MRPTKNRSLNFVSLLVSRDAYSFILYIVKKIRYLKTFVGDNVDENLATGNLFFRQVLYFNGNLGIYKKTI